MSIDIKNASPNISVLIVLHSISKGKFEIMDIEFPDMKSWNIPVFERERIESLQEDASEDVGDYGEVSRAIHNQLWHQNQSERYYCVNVHLWYTTKEDYWTGEFDTKVNFTYELSNFKKEWEHLDLLQMNSKIYYIDYEESKSSYTVLDLFEISDDKYQKPGLYYSVHSDNLPNGTICYSIPVEFVDSENARDRFFSSPEHAHYAYTEFKRIVEQSENER